MNISITYMPNFTTQRPDGTFYFPSSKTSTSSDVLSTALLAPDGSQLDFYADGYRAGYVFLEWNTASNGSGTSYQPGDSVTENLTLYAIWSNPRYIVRGSNLGSIANAIRAKTGKSATMTFPAGFVSEIGDLYTTAEFSKQTTGADVTLIPANQPLVAPGGYAIIHHTEYGQPFTSSFRNAAIDYRYTVTEISGLIDENGDSLSIYDFEACAITTDMWKPNENADFDILIVNKGSTAQYIGGYTVTFKGRGIIMA